MPRAARFDPEQDEILASVGLCDGEDGTKAASVLIVEIRSYKGNIPRVHIERRAGKHLRCAKLGRLTSGEAKGLGELLLRAHDLCVDLGG